MFRACREAEGAQHRGEEIVDESKTSGIKTRWENNDMYTDYMLEPRGSQSMERDSSASPHLFSLPFTLRSRVTLLL